MNERSSELEFDHDQLLSFIRTAGVIISSANLDCVDEKKKKKKKTAIRGLGLILPFKDQNQGPRITVYEPKRQDNKRNKKRLKNTGVRSILKTLDSNAEFETPYISQKTCLSTGAGTKSQRPPLTPSCTWRESPSTAILPLEPIMH